MKDNSVRDNNNKRSTKKKIIIFSCHGGGGHMSAARAIESYLGDDYMIKTVDALGSTLARLDPLFYITIGRYTGQDFYNFLLRRNKKRITNFFFYVGFFLKNLRKRRIHKALHQEIKREKPDIIISVIPLINNFLADIAYQENIPFFLIPTDLDIQSFTHDVSLIRNKHAMLCLGFDYPEITACIDKNLIPVHKIKLTGFPIRKEFFEYKDKEGLKRELGIEPGILVVMIVMGATGSTAMVTYIGQLTKIIVPFHLIICVGRSMYLHSAIQHMTFPEHITYSIFNGKSDISDAMAIADICITKPGSVTFAEILYMNVPVILDNTTPALLWERMNIDMVKMHELGMVITSYKSILSIVTSFLTDKQLRHRLHHNIVNIKKNHFGTNFKQLVDRIC